MGKANKARRILAGVLGLALLLALMLCALCIAADKVLEGTVIGDSIAVNGVCLTVTSLSGRTFTADVMPETVRRTSLARLHPGAKVNLERAVGLLAEELHLVAQAHIGQVGEVHHAHVHADAAASNPSSATASPTA